jgi:hypothetical protein
MKSMSKTTGNNRISALKRLSKPVTINNANRRQLSGPTNPSVNDARQLLANRNKSAFDARQLLSRQSSKTLDTAAPTNVIVRKNLVRMGGEADNNNNGKMVVVTGLKDMKIQDGRVNMKNLKYEKKIIFILQLIQSATIGGTQTEKKKQIFAVGKSTFVTIRNSQNNTNISSNQSTEKISFTKVTFFLFLRKTNFESSYRQSRTHLSVMKTTMVVLKLSMIFLL